MRILVVEDDAELAGLLAMGLRNEAYATDVAATYGQAEEFLRTTAYDVLCLDLGLPDGDGLDLVRRLGADPDLHRPGSLIAVTARDAVTDRVAGLDAGADDYLVKPFHFHELTARLRALARRVADRPAPMRVGDLVLDPATHQVTRAGSALDLTPREYSLLRYFMLHPEMLLSTEDLLEHVWDANANPFTASVRVILSRLRRKLGEPPPIVTVPGVGYQLRRCP